MDRSINAPTSRRRINDAATRAAGFASIRAVVAVFMISNRRAVDRVR
jgi:hypothetical protein